MPFGIIFLELFCHLADFDKHKEATFTLEGLSLENESKIMCKIWWNMKIRNAILLTAVGSIALIAAFCPKPAPTDKEALLLKKMMEALSYLHFSPQNVNDDLSKKVFKLYLDRTDAGRRFLTQAQVDELKQSETMLDDQIKVQDLSFFNRSVQIIEEGINKAEGFYNEALKQQIDFNKSETLELDGDKSGMT
ncbi:MAG: hypothetical protein HC817_09025 [Saprospiraceae bacterium]|nr:hypothetical protein [Saprospiraceae bacterium]